MENIDHYCGEYCVIEKWADEGLKKEKSRKQSR